MNKNKQQGVNMYEIFETKERLSADNTLEAQKVRNTLKEHRVYLINLMASPGAGKTTTLVRMIEELKKDYRVGVMEADVDSDVDAKTISNLGVKVIQLHTGGSCHMTADMTARGMERLNIEDLDVVILENIGNLVCPAEFDTGANLKLVILSVPEGDDKPLKYPLMFQVGDILLFNKIDTKAIFDFDEERCKAHVRKLNPDMEFYSISAKTGEGFSDMMNAICKRIEAWRNVE
ncbi:MAG: hydrogenase nickel incorporation protein HypB [Solobacterium sp.]|nr:hydrogenase nickel incorporation protein HypB [Solobacterium sp.]